MSNSRKFKRQLISAKDRLEQAIYDEIEKVAIRHKIDKMIFSMYSTTLYQNDKEISIKRIEELEEIYWDFIRPGGFEAIWTKEKGWC